MKGNSFKYGVSLMLASAVLTACSEESLDVTINDAAAAEQAAAAEGSAFSTMEEKAGYAIGVNIGMNISSQGIADQVSVDTLLEGLRDALQGGELRQSEQEIMATLQEFSMQQQQKAMAAMEEEEARQQEFLAENATQEGVSTTDSGLQYMVLSEGADGESSPAATDTVTVHYHGTLIDGTVFDSSVDRGEPVSFPLNGVIPGWTEGLQLMSVGDKYRFFIPSDLAYGPNGAPPTIGPNATLIFDVELLGLE